MHCFILKMPLTENDVQSWAVESLKLYLINRGVHVSGKYNRKCRTRGQSQQPAFDEGMNLQIANHVHNVEVNNIFECINYCFMRGKVVPPTRVSESPYDVWVCVSTSTLQVLTGECKCEAGYGETCKHVFGVLHFVEQQVSLGHNKQVSLGHNKTCASKSHAWQQAFKSVKKYTHQQN